MTVIRLDRNMSSVNYVFFPDDMRQIQCPMFLVLLCRATRDLVNCGGKKFSNYRTGLLTDVCVCACVRGVCFDIGLPWRTCNKDQKLLTKKDTHIPPRYAGSTHTHTHTHTHTNKHTQPRFGLCYGFSFADLQRRQKGGMKNLRGH